MKNPFSYGTVVTNENFCGREDLIFQIQEAVESAQNLVLQGERRIGKTSVVCESLRRMKKYRILHVNLMEVKTADDVCKQLLRGLLSLEQKGSRFERTLKKLAHLRPVLSFNSITGDPSISFDGSVLLSPDSLPEVLGLIAQAHDQKPLAVFLDEFQDILKTEDPRAIQAQMRGAIQHQTEVPYIYAGSIRNLMDEIFHGQDSPFFKSAMALDVGPLDDDILTSFIVGKFGAGRRKADKAVVLRILELTERITGDVQQLCSVLWSNTEPGEAIDETHVVEAVKTIFSREQKSYELIINRLSAGNLRVLKALAIMGGEKVTSAKFVSKASVSNASAITQALKRMSQYKIVFHDGKQWRFTNPFFKVWMETFGSSI